MSSLRRRLRSVVPLPVRQEIAHAIRRWRDFRSGIFLNEVRSDAHLCEYTLHAEITQPIMAGALFENKLANLAHGARSVNLSLIAPGRTWSFWRYIRQPTERNGFVVGRNLVNGQLTRQVGGGLCQLSSLMYHLGLLAGLVITERHAHSVDIYQEHERFTPLGADATVVWGHKDLRMNNPHGVNLVFECFVHDHFLTGRVYARGKLPACDVTFVRNQIDVHHVIVNTLVNNQQHAQTFYEQKQGLALQA